MTSTGTAIVTAQAHTLALPDAVRERGISEAQWRTLCDSLYPGAKPESVLMVIDYCAARKLDPLKKPCHIVPMKVRDGKTGEYAWRDVVMPGIYEYRTTAHRTGLYLGHSAPEYGPTADKFGVKAPEWCAMTFYRLGPHAQRIEFPVRRLFAEVVNLKDGRANDRWSRAPVQMLEKCLEAAGLREAFPEEFGGEQTADELDGETPVDALPLPRPGQRKSQPALIPGPSLADPIDPGDGATPPRPHQASPGGSNASGAPPALASPPSRPAHIGKILAVESCGPGGIVRVKLDTGFQAATKDAEIRQGLEALKAKGATVEIETNPSRDPAKFVPIIREIRAVTETT